MTKFYMAKQTDTKPIECSATTLIDAQLEAVAHFAGGSSRVPIYVLELEKPPGWKPGEAPFRMYRCLPWSEITEDLWVIRGDAERELRLEVTHPGVLLREYYMKPRSMSTAELAAHLGKSLEYTKRLLGGHRSITSEDAYDLAYTFETSKEYWLNLQRDYDFRMKSGGDT
ncbi:HigA family addiction module antitoxin [Thiolapillus sp.]|uniref:HigA family addiction module antitoxin n=1 Tax=Thiolapillus sp. TaxID=2017437 RepID=UPI003AF5F842